MRLKFNNRRVCVLMAAVMLLLTTLLPNYAFAGEIVALADNESFTSSAGGVSPFNVDTSWRHWRSDGAIAYCRQKGLNNPDGATGNYYIDAWEPGEQSKIAGLFANADGIAAQYGIGGDSKRALIQMVIWAVESEYDSGNPSPGSVRSSDANMMNAFWALYNAAQAGYTSSSASINGITEGAKLQGKTFSAALVRYGPFSVSGSTSSWASAENAPAGSFFGNAGGTAVNKDSLGNDEDLYFYIPISANSASRIKITIGVTSQGISVHKYNGFRGYQDQLVFLGSDPNSGSRSVSATLLGFGNISLVKQDDETGKALSGATFILQQWNGSAYVNSGYAFSYDTNTRKYSAGPFFETEGNQGKFKIVETGKPYSYLSSWSYEFDAASYGITITRTASNVPVYLDVPLGKSDRNTMAAKPQGDATLAGAVYGIYAAENRTHPDGTVYTADQLIQKQTTDAKGQLTFKKLFPMAYYVKEISPSEGYLLDATKYPVNGVHNGTADKVVVGTAVTEQVKKQKFELIKGGTVDDETEMDLLHAGFRVYLISDLSKVKDGTLTPQSDGWTAKQFRGYDFTDEPVCKIDGVSSVEIFTDSLGKLTSPELPYGTYVVMESTVPQGRMAIYPFIVTVKEDSRVSQPWRLFNDDGKAYFIKIIKKDADTGNIVLGKTAKYRIYDLTKKEYVVMKTTYPKTVYHGTADNPFTVNAEGMLVTPEKLGYGSYRIEEVTAPEGYVKAGFEGTLRSGYEANGQYDPSPAEPLIIDMDARQPIYDGEADEDVLEFEQYNAPQKGKLSLRKDGEVLTDAAKSLFGEYSFRYEKMPLAGAAFEIIAAENIYSQDGHDVLLFSKGGIAETITTDERGEAATTAPLPIGAYTLHESVVPEGFIAAPDSAFSITAMNEEIAFTYTTFGIEDTRQKFDIEILKTDKDTKKPLAGAVFGLYNTEDLAISTNTIPAGTLLMKVKSDENGKVLFADLPAAKYTVLELEVPTGYLLNKDFAAEFDLVYEDGRTDETVTLTAECENIRQKLNIEVIKEDAQTGERLEGGEFTLYDFWGKTIAVAITDKDGIARFSDLSEGTVRIKETKAPAGYQINTDFHPTVKLAYDADGAEVLTWKDVCKETKVPPTPTTPTPAIRHLPKTGDNSHMILWLVIAGASAAVLIGLGAVRRHRKVTEE
jgi:hypothetical protein